MRFDPEIQLAKDDLLLNEFDAPPDLGFENFIASQAC